MALEVQNTTSNASPDTSHRDVFPFLELARELRDNIYRFAYGSTQRLPDELLWDGIDEENFKDHLHLDVEYPPLPSLMRVCKQIKAEYEQSIEKLTTLMVVDNGTFAMDNDGLPPLISTVVRAKYAKIVIFVRCESEFCSGAKDRYSHEPCSVPAETRWTAELVNRISQGLPQLINISVHLGIYWSSECTAVWPNSDHVMIGDTQKALNALSTADKVSRIELFKCPFQTEELRNSMLDDLWASWTAKDGWKAPK